MQVIGEIGHSQLCNLQFEKEKVHHRSEISSQKQFFVYCSRGIKLISILCTAQALDISLTSLFIDKIK